MGITLQKIASAFAGFHQWGLDGEIGWEIKRKRVALPSDIIEAIYPSHTLSRLFS